jgi:hypothetical protein
MKVRSHSLRPSITRGIVVMCVAVFLASPHPASAGTNAWTSHGPVGDFRALAIDPLTPGTLYAGTNGTGVFKSTDAGVTWNAANTGLPADVRALAIDPHTPSTLYAGAVPGLFKSTDAGATWDKLTTEFFFATALVIDPLTPSTLYAGTDFGVFRTTDAGVSSPLKKSASRSEL